MPKSVNKSRQPNWAYFQILNVVVFLVFAGSITYTALYYRHSMKQRASEDSSSSPLTNMFFPLMLLWTACLAYFFGFFGISFLDKEALSESPSTFGLDDVARLADAAEEKEQAKELLRARQHVPRNDTPICAERPLIEKQQQQQEKEKHDHQQQPHAQPQAQQQEGEAGASPAEDINYEGLGDEEVLTHLIDGRLKDYQLEKKLGDHQRAVGLRRGLYEHLLDKNLDLIPYAGYEYGKVFGANCEIVIGYVPIPLGIVGPLTINGEPLYIPMATTEGCLVASTNRGCKAISMAGGCMAVVLKDSITRAPCVRLPSAMRAATVKRWVSNPKNYEQLEAAFNSTTNYGRLESVDATIAGRNVYLRFSCMSGDAMGMNMVSKGCLKAIEVLEREFPDLVLVAISGNMCTDKKPAAVNWILGRGKSIVCEAVIPDRIVKTVLKSTVHDMIETNKQKNHIGSAMAGSIGGFNAHAANIVTAVFLATGQDPAQNVESSNCLTIMEYAEDGKSLHVSVTMPSIEVGTVGGGTHLSAQAGCLDIIGVRGAVSAAQGGSPGDNSRKLALVVGAATLAGELSLMAALAANHLVRSHMQHNRKPQAAAEVAPTSASPAVATGAADTSLPSINRLAAMKKHNSMSDISSFTSATSSH